MLNPRIGFRNFSLILKTKICDCQVLRFRQNRHIVNNTYNLSTSNRLHCTSKAETPKWINITYVFHDGRKIQKKVEVGEPVSKGLEKDSNFIGRALCESVCTCSTCHVYVSPADFKKIGPALCDDEKDLLPYTLDVAETSRLACQIIALPWMEGLELKLPAKVADHTQVDSEYIQT